MQKNSKIYVAGHNGLVGSALVKKLHDAGFTNLVTRSFQELDLRNQQATEQFFATEQPEFVFLAAAKVGGIGANSTYPAEFIYDNLALELNVINAAYKYGAIKLLFLGSSCIYPRDCPQPIKEEYLLTCPLEPTNEWYAIAKIAGLKLCAAYNKQYGTNFISCMPTNLYGPRDNFDLANSHVIPALIAKMCTAQQTNAPTMTIWGTGKPLREFLYVDDLADALIFLMQNYEGNEPINVGSGQEVTIGQIATMIKELVGFTGELIFDTSKPDGTPRKLLNVDKLTKLGWQAPTELTNGLRTTIEWYKNQGAE